MKTALIDADVVLYRATHSAMDELMVGNEVLARLDYAQACELVDHEIYKIKESFKVKDVYCILSYVGEPWRREVLPSYKRNRTGGKPLGYSKVRQYLIDTYKTVEWDPLEGDDVLGILATGVLFYAPRKGSPGVHLPPVSERLVVSVDKDMRTFPCNLVSSWDDEIETVSEDDAYFNFLLQALTGDKTDGYDGCPKVGPVTAKKKLMDAGGPGAEPYDLWKAVVFAYEDAGKTEEDALANARCARILRYKEYDFKTSRPKLWEPPQ
jgi:DNA polymerase-1